jgi:hypothetical protein
MTGPPTTSHLFFLGVDQTTSPQMSSCEYETVSASLCRFAPRPRYYRATYLKMQNVH